MDSKTLQMILKLRGSDASISIHKVCCNKCQYCGGNTSVIHTEFDIKEVEWFGKKETELVAKAVCKTCGKPNIHFTQGEWHWIREV
jgi:hypothetical protein